MDWKYEYGNNEEKKLHLIKFDFKWLRLWDLKLWNISNLLFYLFLDAFNMQLSSICSPIWLNEEMFSSLLLWYCLVIKVWVHRELAV